LAVTAGCSATPEKAAAQPAGAPGPAGSPGPTPSVQITAENALPGSKDWKIRKRGAPNEIEGYADRVSVLPGEEFRLYVSTTTPDWKAEAFRVGWYGGDQARKVWTSEVEPGSRQAAAKIDPVTRTVTAPWTPSLTVRAAGWPEGSYLIKLTAHSGAQRYVPITVRSATTAGRTVLLNETTTWQAYNTWGGYNLYTGPAGAADRSKAVSFDRPYDRDGAYKFFAHEQASIVLAEKLGLPLAYTTDNDLHASPDLLDGARSLITLGHDEYWSKEMWAHARSARDQGVNLAFLGANAVNRHIRFAPTKLGADRLVICYKGEDDPIGRTDPSEITVDWRFGSPPRPESSLIGVQYSCFPADGPFTISKAGSWVFRGTGVKNGDSFEGLIGPETDQLNWYGPIPRPIEVLANSRIRCGTSSTTSNATYYTTKSGAGVFATGTMRWNCALGGLTCGHGVTKQTSTFVKKVTTNILRAFAAGPAATTHPAHDNLKTTSR
jgi:hypothetical protein